MPSLRLSDKREICERLWLLFPLYKNNNPFILPEHSVLQEDRRAHICVVP